VSKVAAVSPNVEAEIEIPDQSDFYKLPARFGAIPLDEAPLGYEVETKRRETKKTKFEHAYPRIYLPLQEVQRVEFGHGKKFEPTDLFPTGANRLFFGDCLHVMRQLPSRSIDLIYIDPPFFSGRQYNVIFGDKNEMRSFSDIWEGGMPGYLIWLNARLFEMKRLLKDTGSIYVHLDWRAVHYVKVEMDKIFGSGGQKGTEAGFKTEIVWQFDIGGRPQNCWARKHHVILFYTKSATWKFNADDIRVPYKTQVAGRKNPLISPEKYARGKIPTTVWEIHVTLEFKERIGYPTQKPEQLLERIVKHRQAKAMLLLTSSSAGVRPRQSPSD